MLSSGALISSIGGITKSKKPFMMSDKMLLKNNLKSKYLTSLLAFEDLLILGLKTAKCRKIATK
jgi:hypothetical protein